MLGNSWLSAQLAVSEAGLSSVELVSFKIIMTFNYQYLEDLLITAYEVNFMEEYSGTQRINKHESCFSTRYETHCCYRVQTLISWPRGVLFLGDPYYYYVNVQGSVFNGISVFTT
jgi:hypothetical protein